MDRTDEQIQDDVEAELRWTPELDAAAIGVTVRDGVVSLYGDVQDYPERIAADRAARRVRGVAALGEAGGNRRPYFTLDHEPWLRIQRHHQPRSLRPDRPLRDYGQGGDVARKTARSERSNG